MLKKVLKTVFLVELLKGMAITLRHLFTHAVTEQYPKQRPTLAERYRGIPRLNADPETQKSFLKSQYIRWDGHVGGTKWKAEFEKLRQELIPDYKPEDLQAPTTQP